MENSKIWRCICILFCVYSLKIFLDEHYEIIYRRAGKKSEDQILYLACRELKGLDLNATVLSLDQLRDGLSLLQPKTSRPG